jgi:HSP20 family protein
MKERTLQRWDPFAPAHWENPFGLLRRLTADMERFLDLRTPRLSPEAPEVVEPAWLPSIDVYEREGALVVRADLPGLTKDDVKVDVTEEAITLKGERKREVEEKKEGLYRLERAYGSFYREVPLPEGVNLDEVKATFRDGVLEITAPLPAAGRKPEPRRVAIGEEAGEKKGQSAAA